MRVLLFTDTLGDLNGVSRFISDMAEAARMHHDTLHVITSTAKRCPEAENIHNFEPRVRLRMPFYKELDLAFPPSRKIEAFVDAFKPEVVHISTPGPVGILGRRIARKLGVPILGTYHTDFPAYIRDNTRSATLKKLTDRMMQRFYAPFSHMFSRSLIYETVMREEIGIDGAKISTIPAGTNLLRFSSAHRETRYWDDFEISSESVKVLYVGRITVEKNIPFLLKVWKKLRHDHPDLDADLILVGEGKLKKQVNALANHRVHYFGPIYTEELSHIYAASDLFVFPSVTDTLGQVVMEASASGLAVLVSDQGGPQSLINTKLQNGYVIEANNIDAWVAILVRLIGSRLLRQELGYGAQQNMQNFDIRNSYEHFWQTHRRYYPM